VDGCRIDQATENPTGGSGVVAIVDAFDNPFAERDLAAFSSQFGLPACTTANGCFKQVYARGSQPANDPGGWSLEIALDIEMAHAFAPDAKIVLVEAQDNTGPELIFAEDLAAQMVAQGGGGTISNSWSGKEGPLELTAGFPLPGAGSHLLRLHGRQRGAGRLSRGLSLRRGSGRHDHPSRQRRLHG
jgi:subtilase family serine protease